MNRWLTGCAVLAGLVGMAAGAVHAAPPPVPAQPAPPPQGEVAADFLVSLRHLIEDCDKSPAIVVAEIGGHPITRGDVADALRSIPAVDGGQSLETVYRQAVQSLMAQQAMVVRAHEQGLDKDPAVQRRLAAAATNLLSNEYLRHTIPGMITDAQLHEAYDRDFAGKPGPDEVRARIIMTQSEDEAKDALAKLASGSDFADLARAVSKDPSGKAGGDLGFVRQESIAPQLASVMFSLPPGQTNSYPVRAAANAWFVIRVEARRQQGTPSFESVRDRLMQQLMRAAAPAAVQKAVAGLEVKDYGLAGKAQAAAK